MGTTALTRLNLKLEKTKLDRLRRQLRARSNSEAVCKAVEEALAIGRIQMALRGLQATNGLRDVLGRVPPKRR